MVLGLMVGVGVEVGVEVGGASVGLTVGIGVGVEANISGNQYEWSESGVGVGLPMLTTGVMNPSAMIRATITKATQAIAVRVKLILTSYLGLSVKVQTGKTI